MSSPMEIRVMIADDHAMFREALCHMLGTQADLEVVAQTGDGLQIIPLAHEFAPHVVCMDISMPGMNGIDVTRALLQERPLIKVVALSAYTDQSHVLEMLGAGASAYVTKVEAGDELLRAIRAVLRGRIYLCPDVSGVVTDVLKKRERTPRSTVLLSERERQVLKQVAAGFTSSQIARELLIAASTVEVHRRNIMRKLDRHSVAELTRYVMSRERDDQSA
jgi:two-component system NarL family response regulator